MLFTRSSSTSDCSSSTGVSFTLSLGRFTVEGGGFFASSVRSSPRPSVVGSGGFSCPPGAGAGCGGGGEGACAYAAVVLASVDGAERGLYHRSVLAEVREHRAKGGTFVDTGANARDARTADLGVRCATVPGRMAASLRARSFLAVAAVASLSIMACKADTDLGKPGCNLLKALPDGGATNVIVGELSAG